MRFLALATIVLAAAPAPALADVELASPNGFISSFREEVQATPRAVWQAIEQLPRWWSDDHTWSGKAANMSLDLQAGGCWCERWGDGQSVMHGQIVLVLPGQMMRMNANLGPLQDLATSGVLTLATGAADGKTVMRMSYRVAGSPAAGLDKLATIVDGVLAAQFRRLKRMAESGKPD